MDLLDPTKGFIRNDTITIVADIVVYGDIQTTIISQLQRFRTSCGLVDDVKALLFDELSCDCYVIASYQTEHSGVAIAGEHINTINYLQFRSTMYNDRIPVHRFILQARSPVFRAMLSSGMVESSSSQIIITDFDHDVVKEFVRFLYVDICDVAALVRHGKALLAIAHKYEVEGLLQACENQLVGELSVDSAVDMLRLGDKYGAVQLKERALQYIKINFSAITHQHSLFYESLSSELRHDLIRALADSSS